MLAKKTFRGLTLFLAIGIGGQVFAQDANGGGGGGTPLIIAIYPQRQLERRQSRWTLSDWMKTRREIDRQNQWLWSHTNKLPMDFTLGWDMSKVRQGFEADVYAMRLGFRLRYEEAAQWLGSTSSSAIDNHRVETDLQARLLGGNIQDTNLIVRVSYEYNDLILPNSTHGYFTGFGFGPELQIYFSQWLGVRGDYQKILKQETRFQDKAFSGHSYSYVGFIELGSLRGEIGYRSKTLTYSKGFSGDINESGLFGRIRLFF